MGARWLEVADSRLWHLLGMTYLSATLAVVVSCGTPQPNGSSHISTDQGNGLFCDPDLAVVPASEVVVEGSLELEQRQMVSWALERFAAADLRMPATIKVGFDHSGVGCEGGTGICRASASPPEAIVCESKGDTAYRRINREITLLHELAHIWHWARGDGENWLDYSAVVGGASDSPGIEWEDRTHERVAIVISWGLFDHLRRPVRSDLKCVDLYVQFEQLTQHPPLEPLHTSCIPALVTNQD